MRNSLIATLILIMSAICCCSGSGGGSSAVEETEEVSVTSTIEPNTDTPEPKSTRTPIPKKEYFLLSEAASYSVFLDHSTDRGEGKGIKVYLGDSKQFIFEIIGGSPNCPRMPSGEAYLVRYEDGTQEWRDRQVVENPMAYVKNDSSLYLHDWTFYASCP